MKKRFTLFTTFMLFFLYSTINGQIAKHEAAYIYNFTRFIKWPDTQAAGDFVIAILGKDEEITKELSASSANRTVGSRSIKIKEFSSVDEIPDCHILFVSDSKSIHLKIVAQKLAGKPIVIISEEMQRNPTESTINLHLLDQKLAFHINKMDAETRQVIISEKLLGLSK
ncbi:MAG: YfiR family protein [Marinilabiliaceae bacterium]|nr:YfiR family protein [Marinilabiliaceae bacterium]